jgi:Fibrobacter succinogenes major domain (Fib_succ_major)
MLKKLIFLLPIFVLLQLCLYAQVGIGTATPDASAKLDVSSTTSGFLPPRMTYAQKTAISSPAAGLMVWCSNCGISGEIQVYNGTTWTNMIGGTTLVALPTLAATTAATSIEASSATSGGNVTADGGGASVTARGVCWSTTTGPTIALSTKTSDGSGTGVFTSSITGLTAVTLYYVRAYATNSSGTSYGAEVSFTTVPTIVSSTGKTWMDRNLGATQAATSSTDAYAYGDLYQWGRAADGHQIRTSGTTATLSITDTPGNALFITTNGGTFDWRSSQNNNLWQGVDGVNNPCPSGFRLPTITELDAERAIWGTQNAAGAFASSLKLTKAGSRIYDGSLNSYGSAANYWSSTVNGTNSFFLQFDIGVVNCYSDFRADGFSVRCIKN